jgi:hypothetical protein
VLGLVEIKHTDVCDTYELSLRSRLLSRVRAVEEYWKRVRQCISLLNLECSDGRITVGRWQSFDKETTRALAW